MPNPYFSFKLFTIYHDRCAMKVTTDACLFGAWCADKLNKEKSKINKALDIGTGTGLLSLMVAQQHKIAIDAVEIDTAAAGQAKANFEASPWKQQLQVVTGNILQLTTHHTYDCIFSNPPFYERELTSPDNLRNVAHHSQQLTLNALLQFIKNSLRAEGSFYLLLPHKRLEESYLLMQKNSLVIEEEVMVHASTVHPPFRFMIKGRHKLDVAKKTGSLYIKDENGTYTAAFVQLLKPYYLNL